jgi:ABC-type uncharacterized transport system substrate-binding protein
MLWMITANERLSRSLPLALILMLSGCAMTPPPEPPAPPEPEPIEIIPAPDPGPEPEPEPVEIIPAPAPRALPSVSIVLTSDQPAYADVARELTQNFSDYEIFDLSSDTRPPVSLLRIINDSESGAVVAIGLRAAKSSVAMSNKPVIFSQVFNYQDHELLTRNSRGIAAIAPLEGQLRAWQQADATIQRVGAIVGEGHDELIAEARRAANELGIELSIAVTSSDQETLYVFKRMVRNIDGFWLFPDNRVLSARAFRQMIDDAKRHNVAVLVPSESMLQAGASISVTSVAADIAATIARIVRKIDAGRIDEVPPISKLSEIRVTTNETMQVVER